MLVSHGRLAVAVWQGHDQNPVDAILAESMVRFGRPQAARQLVGHALGDAEALRTLVASAGSRDVRIRSVTKSHCSPSAKCPERARVAPSHVSTVTWMHVEVRDDAAYARARGWVLPMAAHLLTARA